MNENDNSDDWFEMVNLNKKEKGFYVTFDDGLYIKILGTCTIVNQSMV